MSTMKVFENSQFGKITTVIKGDEKWIVGKEVASILGYKNSRDALKRHVDPDDKADVVIYDGSQNRNVIAINESGLYSLVLSSKLPSAKEFKRWVTKEVLPSIRKHGMYAMDELLDNPDLAISALQALKAEREEKRMLQLHIDENRGFTNFGKAISNVEQGILIGDYAKLLRNDGIDIGQKRLFKWLRENGYLMKSGRSKNQPMQRYVEQGLFYTAERVGNTHTGDWISVTTYITGKGQLYFIDKIRPNFDIVDKRGAVANGNNS